MGTEQTAVVSFSSSPEQNKREAMFDITFKEVDKLTRQAETRAHQLGPVTTRNEATPGNEAKKTLPENVANFVGGYIFWEPHTQK